MAEFNTGIKEAIDDAISRFEENLGKHSELEILGWLEIAHGAGFMKEAYVLDHLMDDRRSLDKDG